MYAKTWAGTVCGIEGMTVAVEVDIANGLPQFDVVGLGGSAIKEARDRVRAAIRNGGFDFPLQRITVNLAPADVRKEGSAFDLAMALGILAASRQIPPVPERTIILGELALDGTLRGVPGVLPVLLAAREQGVTAAIVPESNRAEAQLAELRVFAVSSLKEAVTAWEGGRPCSPAAGERPAVTLLAGTAGESHDFADVLGQESVKRGLEVAAAGFHNVLLSGPPGSGKTLLASCLPSIMPAMSTEESFDVTIIYSIAGQLTGRGGLVTQRPFRSPHHTVSQAALIGGGSQLPRPGECTLAHGGILFLDELPEFSRHALEVLRQPLESGEVTIARSRQTVRYPARFLLVGSMNPCPCGYYGCHGLQECTCSPQQVQRYRARLSGPLMDRIDLHLEVPRVSVTMLGERRQAEPSAMIQQRVEAARERQTERFGHRRSFPYNSGMAPGELRRLATLDREGRDLLRSAFEAMGLSARAYDRIVKVARTIADLEGSDAISADHVAEAIRYRALDRGVRG